MVGWKDDIWKMNNCRPKRLIRKKVLSKKKSQKLTTHQCKGMKQMIRLDQTSCTKLGNTPDETMKMRGMT